MRVLAAFSRLLQWRAMRKLSAIMSNSDVQQLYAELNTLHFEGVLPPCRIVWSRQLTRAAGNIQVKARIIKLSIPLLLEAFSSASLFPREYLVCGVRCDNAETAVREILKHEMIHLWLFVRGLPHGHTAAFRAKARSLGQTKIRHEIEVPTPKSGYLYSCPNCAREYSRRRRYGRARACGPCCKAFNGGAYHERFKLRGRKIRRN
jgi:ribosomal protein L37AE/L43A